MKVTMTEVVDCRYQTRRASMPFFCIYHLGIKAGRRMGERRANKGCAAYVDRYSSRLVLCAIGILVLSGLDAAFTLAILANGGVELNGLMAVLIEAGVTTFVSVKLILTGLALILLIIHHDVLLTEKIRVRHLKYMLLVSYSCLIGYEIYLLRLAYS